MDTIFKTGDILAFHSHGTFSSLITLGEKIRSSDGSPIPSHVAIVRDSTTIIESTTLGKTPDFELHKVLKGVQRVAIEERIASHQGSIWHVPLKDPLSESDSNRMVKWLDEIKHQELGYDWAGIAGIGIELITGLKLHTWENFGQLFCSELATKALQIAGVVPDDLSPFEQTPADVIRFICMDKPIVLKTEMKAVRFDFRLENWKKELTTLRV